MAGEFNPAVTPCPKNVERAVKISKGQENNCSKFRSFGYEFLIDWSYNGPPKKLSWSISEEEIDERR